MSKRYDAAIIGAGPGGYAAAIRLSQLEKSVCVIDAEEDRIGGVCLNEGCIPVKSLLSGAKVLSDIKKARGFGVEADIRVTDMRKLAAHASGAGLKLRGGIKALFKKHGVVFIEGRAKLVSADKISVASKNGETDVEAGNIIIAAGSSPAIPSGIEADGERILTSSDAIRLHNVPKTLVIIGAGAIGAEFCSLFTTLGSKVTIVEMMKNIIPFEDEEVSKTLERAFNKRGAEVLTGTKLKSIIKRKDGCEAVLDTAGKEKKIESERVLIAMGRKPNTSGIGLNGLEVKTIGGFIVTDSRMRTTVENIYAVGDVVNTPMYAHVAYKEGITAAESIAGRKTEPIDYGNVPSVVFSEPQVASVGLTEVKAKAGGYDVAVSKQFFKANGLAVATGREEGFIKIVADKKTRGILGAHIIGSEATEIIHEFVIAKSAGLKVDDIAKAVHAHPTFSETAADAAKAVFDKPIHG